MSLPREGQAPGRAQTPVPSLLASCISLLEPCLTLHLRLRPSGSGTGKAGLGRDTKHRNHRRVPSPLRRPSPAAFHKYSRFSSLVGHVPANPKLVLLEVKTDTPHAHAHTPLAYIISNPQTTRPGPFCFLYFAQETLRLRVPSACLELPLYPLPAGPRAGASCAAWQAPPTPPLVISPGRWSNREKWPFVPPQRGIGLSCDSNPSPPCML